MQLIRERIANLTMAAAACGKRPLGGASPRHTLSPLLGLGRLALVSSGERVALWRGVRPA